MWLPPASPFWGSRGGASSQQEGVGRIGAGIVGFWMIEYSGNCPRKPKNLPQGTMEAAEPLTVTTSGQWCHYGVHPFLTGAMGLCDGNLYTELLGHENIIHDTCDMKEGMQELPLLLPCHLERMEFERSIDLGTGTRDTCEE